MRSFAKWLVIIWSMLCLAGLISNLIHVVQHPTGTSDAAKWMWGVIWFAVAGPATIIFLVCAKKDPSPRQVTHPKKP